MPLRRRPAVKRMPVSASGARKRVLEKLIEEATVDCYNESEAATGLLTFLEDRIACPTAATVIGMPVTVLRLDLDEQEGTVIAVCRVKGRQEKIPIRLVVWANLTKSGTDAIDAYLMWSRG